MKNMYVGMSAVTTALESINVSATNLVATIGHGRVAKVGEVVARPMTEQEAAHKAAYLAHTAEAAAIHEARQAEVEERKALRANGRMARKAAAQALREQAEEAAKARAERRAKAADEQAEREAREAALNNLATGLEPRSYRKITGPKPESYKHLLVHAEALIPEEIEALRKLAKIKKTDNEAVWAMRTGINELCEKLQQKIDAGKPVVANPAMCTWETGHQGAGTDIAGVVYGTATRLIIETEVKVFDFVRLNETVMKSAFHDPEEVTDKVTQLLQDVFTVNGISLDGYTYRIWAASNSMQKQGKAYFGESKMMARTEKARHYCAALAQIGHGKGTTGADELKVQALLFTPSTIMYTVDGRPVTINDVAVSPSIKKHQLVKRAFVMNDNGKARQELNYETERTLFDGQINWTCVLSGQNRSGCGHKGLGIYAKSILEEMFDGWENNVIDTLIGKVRAGNYLGFTTEDTFKASKLSEDYAQFVATLNELEKEFPGISCFRVVRYADAAEEKPRHTARQLMQQFINGTDELVYACTKRDVRRLVEDKCASKVLARLAGLEKPEYERSAVEAIFGRTNLVAAPQIVQWLHECWEDRKSDVCSGRVTVNGDYPYITEDPVAFFQIIFGLKNPDDPDLGVLKAGEANACGLKHGQEFGVVRFPANFLTAQILENTNEYNNVFSSLGNVAVVNVHDETMAKQDADVDGDEWLEVEDDWAITLIKMMNIMFGDRGVPTIIFDHASAKDMTVVHDDRELAQLISKSLWLAQKYNRVGRYSNLASICLHYAADAYKRGNLRAMQHWLNNTMYANVGTILVIDMVKTGYAPEGLILMLDKIEQEVGSKMPYNQRYNKHTYVHPYWSEDWDEKLNAPGLAFVDRMATHVEKEVGNFSFDTEGLVFNPDVLRCHEEGVIDFAPRGRIPAELEAKIGLFNRNKKEAVKPGEDGKYSAKELMKFVWQNSCALKFSIANDELRPEDAAAMKAELMRFCRDILLSLDDGGAIEKWQPLNTRQRAKSIVNWFVDDAFEQYHLADGRTVCRSNGIGTNAATEWECNHLKSSYCRFVIEVFAEDIIDNVENNLGVPMDEKWVRPESEVCFDDSNDLEF